MPIDPAFLQPGGALVSPLLQRALGELGAAEQAQELPAGARIGAYRIVRELGRGGMAVVYLAERADGEFEQTVALKLLRPDHDSPLAQELLRQERQVLAGLQHPCIARLLDGGRTEDGTLWFALELVHGVRIDRHCSERQLPLRARLELFMQVCAAVQFAHSRLLIHRDIKPANILVTHDGTVKLLDFGIAQLLTPDARAPLAVRALTPGYASPEQLHGEPVTTASDIYQLGNLLQSILHPNATAASATEHTRLRPLPPQAPAAAAVRGDGGLALIAAKAMQPLPAQRYATAAELQADVENFLNHWPLRAHGGGALYRTRCFVRRHALAVGAASIMFAALLAGVTAVIWQAQVARTEAARAQAVQAFLVGLFDDLDPAHGEGRDVTVRKLLERGERDVAGALAGQPDIKLTMLGVLGDIYNKLQYAEPAERMQRARAELAQRLHGEHSDSYADALFGLATAGFATRTNLDDAARQAQVVVAYREQAYGKDSMATLEARRLQAEIQGLQNDHEAAAKTVAQLIPNYESRFGANSIEVTSLRMALLEHRTGGGSSWQQELPELRELAANVSDPRPEQKREWLELQIDFGIALMYAGDAQRSETLLKRGIDGLDELLGPENSTSIDARRTLGVLYFNRGNYAASLEQHRVASTIADHAYGHEHSEAALNRGFQERPLLYLGRYAEAEAMAREERDTILRSPSTEPVLRNASRTSLAACLLLLGQFDAAREEAQAVLPDDRATAARKVGLSQDLMIMGAADSEQALHPRALAEFDEAVAVVEQMPGPPTVHTARALLAQAIGRARAGHADTAETSLAQARAILRQRLPADHPLLRIADLAEAEVVRAKGDAVAADALHEQAALALKNGNGVVTGARFWPVF